MKQKHSIYFVALFCLATSLLGACSDEDELDSGVVQQDNKIENRQGRFDEPPFVWDYTYSTEEEADSSFRTSVCPHQSFRDYQHPFSVQVLRKPVLLGRY